MAATLAAGAASFSNATQPATVGLDMLVPDAVNRPPPMASEMTLLPGASTSVVVLVFENEVTASAVLVAPTDTTPDRHAGADIDVVEPLLAAEATAITPWAARLSTTASAAMSHEVAASQSPANSALVPRLMLITSTPYCGLLAMKSRAAVISANV